ncbi:2',3'-cyclic-nucleotide 3'-phosphodiesterase [Trametes elegans]|nr:2',3'-cyclic-nucleotide 3'-phosphodiesterase [Trametes elegans]
MGISLWLVPRPTQAAQIAHAMRLKPPSTRSPASFPPFPPHVTLASASSAAALRAAVPASQRAIPARFRSLEVGEKYFTSVYVAVHSAPGSPLEDLRTALEQAEGVSVPPVAHLSLYYIDDADREERARTAETLRRELRVLESGTDEDRSLRLACVDENADDTSREPDILEGFDGEEIWVVRCEGPVPEWEVLERIKLA